MRRARLVCLGAAATLVLSAADSGHAAPPPSPAPAASAPTLDAAAKAAAGPAAPPPTPAPGRARAKALYDEARAAAERKEYAAAARLFAQADALAPAPIALKSALKAALAADHGPLAMELAARATTRGAGAAVDRLAADARARFADKTATLLVRCLAACRVRVDGADVPANEARWFTSGLHVVELRDASGTRRENVQLQPGQRFELQGASPPPAPAPAPRPAPAPLPAPPPAQGGIAPGWFWGGLAITGALGGGTLASALETRARHARFVDEGGGDAEAGRASQLRTNALFFTTVGVAAVTAALGIFAVDWGGGDTAKASAWMDPTGGGAGLEGTF